MPGGKIHRGITLNALKNIPEWEKRIIDDELKKIYESDFSPDNYFDIKDGYFKALKYTYFIDGIQFHYLPDYNLGKEYKFWKVKTNKKGKPYSLERISDYQNKNWQHFYKGFNYYFKKSILCLKNNKLDDFAGFLGVILHVIQDATNTLHSLEGYEGTDIFVLDRLITPHSSSPEYLPSSILSKDIDVPEFSFSPSILGEKPQEAVFLLFSKLNNTVENTRKLLIPIIMNTYKKREKEVYALYNKMFLSSSKLCADVINTIFCIAFHKFKKDEIEKLKKIYLSDIKPIKKPCVVSQPYRFISILKDKAFDKNRNIIPLSLYVNGKIKKFKKGWSTGAHYQHSIVFHIPRDVYKTFSCYLGLHSSSGEKGDVEIKIKFRKKTKFRKHFKGNKSSEKIIFSVAAGGLLEFNIRSKDGMSNPDNNIVFGSPLLEK